MPNMIDRHDGSAPGPETGRRGISSHPHIRRYMTVVGDVMEYENEAGVVVVVSRCWLPRTTHNTYYVHLMLDEFPGLPWC